MGLVTLVDQLDGLITRRARTSEIMPLLITLRDQCKATELRLRSFQTKAKTPDKDVLIASLQRDLEEANKRYAQLHANQMPNQRPPIDPKGRFTYT